MTIIFKNHNLKKSTAERSGSVAWRSPSNIALIKYWGKFGHQLPRNPSLSITLQNAFTEMMLAYESNEKLNNQISLEFTFEGKTNKVFENRIQNFLNRNIEYIPFLKNLHLSIESKNSFPHSSGIASSASSMSALALCITSIYEQLYDIKLSASDFKQKASQLSRLASGSACRSVFSKMAVWGNTDTIKSSSNEFAIEYSNFHSNFLNFHDDILIVSPFEKKVSSSQGHKLMDSNRFASERYKQANSHLHDLTHSLINGDVWSAGKIIEDEALVLHALMMCSDPSYILMEPNTLKIIQLIRVYRKESGIPVFFSLDAGPNIHLLYPHKDRQKITDFVNEKLIHYCHESKVIRDQMGDGPVLLS